MIENGWKHFSRGHIHSYITATKMVISLCPEEFLNSFKAFIVQIRNKVSLNSSLLTEFKMQLSWVFFDVC